MKKLLLLFISFTFLTHVHSGIFAGKEDIILNQLHIDSTQYSPDLTAKKTWPYTPALSILILAQIIPQEDSWEAQEHQLYLYLIDNETGKIAATFDGDLSAATDTMPLTGVSIDTAAYDIKKDSRAFGVRITYTGQSRANPITEETLSLFTYENGKIVRILKDLPVLETEGMYGGTCEDYFTKTVKTLIVSNKETNSYKNLTVKAVTKKIFDNAFIEDGQTCPEVKPVITKNTSSLKFNDGEYK
ncbi:hypothetical protein AAIR98_000522 [Elusimicrobium simillimum]|uniref:hypothetical protein n=1 Tax=Elusimicrobium simillimum TaxID=3143438 RepID=UPI003C70357A